MNEIEKFKNDVQMNIARQGEDKNLKELSLNWIRQTDRYQYDYNFTWLGRPIIQYPQDIIAMQEIIWKVQPDLIIETGVAHGGSLIFYASMLEMLQNSGTVIGIDIDIRKHNRREIEAHRMHNNIILIEQSSTDEKAVARIQKIIQDHKKTNVMVVLDSNHTHEHVLKELDLYASFVSKGSYLVVFDTVIEDMPQGHFSNRSWDKNNNPKTAVREFLKRNRDFVVDKSIEDKLLITAAPEGYLKCVRDE